MHRQSTAGGDGSPESNEQDGQSTIMRHVSSYSDLREIHQDEAAAGPTLEMQRRQRGAATKRHMVAEDGGNIGKENDGIGPAELLANGLADRGLARWSNWGPASAPDRHSAEEALAAGVAAQRPHSSAGALAGVTVSVRSSS